MKREIIEHFDRTWNDYDQWFNEHQALYETELAALRLAVPTGAGLEIGVGTGRFAAPLRVRYGLDPAGATAPERIKGLRQQVISRLEAGDHTLFVARIDSGEVLRDAEPLDSRTLGETYQGE